MDKNFHPLDVKLTIGNQGLKITNLIWKFCLRILSFLEQSIFFFIFNKILLLLKKKKIDMKRASDYLNQIHTYLTIRMHYESKMGN